jgi:hypothetical protein
MLRRPSLLGSFALVLLASCSSKDDAPTNGVATSAFSAVFKLAEGGKADLVSVPFPSDLLLDASGAIRLDAAAGLSELVPSNKGAQYIADALAVTKGFGVYGGVLFALAGDAPDTSKLPTGKRGDCQGKDSPTYLVDVDAGTVLDCRAAWNDDNALNKDTGTQPMLSVQTARGLVLPEKHKIVALVTSSLVGKKTGSKLAASPDFIAIRDGRRTDASARLYQDGIDKAVAKLGIDKSAVVAAAVYTTGAVSSDLFAMREEANKQPMPALKWDKAAVAPVEPVKFTSVAPLPAGWTASLDDLLGKPKQLDGKDDPDWDAAEGVAHDALGAIGVAEMDAPNLLVDAPTGFADPKHATVFHDGAGKVAINPSKPTNKVWVSVFLPKTAAPAEGYPVVVFQHGMSGQRGDALAMANTFARKGWATVAIDAIQQGTRGASATARGDKVVNYKRSGTVYAGPDGFTDRDGDGGNESATDLFGGLFRLAAMRDQFRQSAVDHSTLYRVLAASPTLEGLAVDGKAPKLDGARVAYFGISLGGILGTLVAGIEPGHKAYILQVPGGALLSELASHSPYIYGLLNGSAALNFGFRNCQAPPWHPMVQLMQHALDGGDPIGLAPFAVAAPPAGQKPRNVLMFEAIADDIVSNESTEALARAMGLRLAEPAVSALADIPRVSGAGATNVPAMGATGVLVQLSPAQHGVHVLSRTGERRYALTRAQFGDVSVDPFPLLPKPITFENPYLDAQDASVKFVDEAFGAKVPTLNWTKAPVAPKD